MKVNRGRFAFTREGRRVASSRATRTGTSCAAEVAKAEKGFLADAKVKLYNSTDHVADFLDRVKDREKPITSEQVGGRTVICCHLMNLAYEPTARSCGTLPPATSRAAPATRRG